MTDGLTSSYETRLVLALRHHDVPGTRLAESGESVTEAFGSPEDYAARVASSAGERVPPASPALLVAAVLLPAGGSAALAEGVYRLGARGRADLGWLAAPPLALIAAGAVLLACATLLVRPHIDRIVDPRTRRPVLLSIRARFALVGLPVAMLVVLWLLGRAAA
jgi:hypothetical protein